MNSGRFDKLTGRIRPGTYINVDSNTQPGIQFATRGSALIPLVNSWGPNATIIKVEATAISAHDAELGDSVYNILLLAEAIKGAGTLLVYNINKGTKSTVTKTIQEATEEAAASVLTITAKYGGTRGNDLKVSSTANPEGGYDLKVILDTTTVEEYTGVADIEAAASLESAYVLFAGSGSLGEFAALSLAGGTAGEVTNADISAMLDAVEDEPVSCICFPFTDATLKAVAVSKVRYLRDNCGKSIQVVLSDYPQADYEGVINVTNSYARSDGVALTHAQATAYVAAITAAATETVSNTYKVVADADTVVDKKTNEEAEAAILAGEFFFTQEQERVIVEYDINSLHTFTKTRSKSYRKNKVLRVYDALSDTLRLTFPPNRFTNDETGWNLMDGLCQTILQYYLDESAIKNVDIANDLKVNRGECEGDSVYFDARIHAVDAAEKLYFTVITD
jgi:hypothetical protein